MMYIVFLLILALTCHGDGQQNCSDNCNKALGMEDNRIKNSQIIGGSAYNGDYVNFGSQNARLHNSRGFKADPTTLPPSSNVIEVQFEEEMVVTGIATQGYGDEWVTSFNMFYSDSLGNQQPVKDVDGKQMEFLGNTDSNTVKRNSLPIPVFASSVFFFPLTVHENVGLRMEFYGCKGGHYFIVWLMLKGTFFTVAYTDPANYQYQDAISNTLDEVNRILSTTWGYLHAHIRELSPQTSPSLLTVVTAVIEIHCLRSSEQTLLTKLKSVMESNYDGIFDPGFIKFQYPKRCKCPPPKAKFKLGKTMKHAEELFLSKIFMRLPIQLEHSCPPTTALLYSWKLSKIDKETGLFGPLQSWGRKKMFVLPLRMIGIGYAYIHCEVELPGEAGSMAFDYGYIRIVRDPLVAIVTDMTESRTQIMLSAGKSFDAGRKRYGTRGLQFTWFCRLEGETFLDLRFVVDKAFGRSKRHRGCFGFGPGRLTSKDEVLVLNIKEMVKSKKYIFKLVVNKDDRNASAVYEFAVKPLVSIFVRCLSNCGQKVSPHDRLLLEAFCTGEACSNVSKYNWNLLSLEQSGNDLSLSPVNHVQIYPQMDSRRLLINDIFKLKDETIKNIHYAVKAGVKLNDEVEFSGNFSFVVNSPPMRLAPDSSCHVVPMEGEAVSTDFIITCSGWYDPDKPLIYDFRYRDKYGMVIIQVGNLNKVATKLPVGEAAEDYALVLEALVGDSYKAFTATRMVVKVRPPKPFAFNDEFVNKQLNVIRDFVQVGDADRATEMAFMLMSTVKDLRDESFDKKSSSILHDMKGLKVKSVVHVTKVAAVVVWATENSQTASPSLQANAFSLLSEATNFMASQFSSNSTHDVMVAKNVSSVLLNSIGSLLRISSNDARIETKDVSRKENGRENTIKTLELARQVGEVLSSTQHTDQRKTVVTSNFVDIVIYKDKPEDLSGRNISEGGADIVMPDSKNIFPRTNDSVTLQLMAFKENPYTWDKTASNIRSTVIDVTVRSSEGTEVKVNNLSKPLGLHIPKKQKEKNLQPMKQPRHLFLQPEIIRYHTVVIPSKEHLLSLRVDTVETRQLTVYFGLGFKPNASNYSSVVNLPDFSSCQNNTTDKSFNCTDDIQSVKLTGYDPGLYYVGVTLAVPVARLRRSCTGTGRRGKRSCVEVKDPPTTPPPTPLIVTPQYNANTDVNYTFSVTMGTCLYWSEEQEMWSSKGCKVGSESKPGRVHCLCTHLTSFGGDFFVAPNPIDFEKVWSEFGRLGETGNYVVLATVCSMLGCYLLGLMFARRADKKDELKVVAEFHLSDAQNGEHTYSISIQTGAWRNSGTTANVGMVLYGEEGVSNPIIFACQQLQRIFFARGSVNTFTLSLPKSLGSLFKLNVWHDNSGNSPSWFLLEIVVEDVQTREKWHFIANRWLAVEKGLGEIELELKAATKDDLLEFKNVLQSRTQKAVGDSHLWISLFTKPPHNQFTRCQRLSCCLSIIFCAMVTGAMFYRFGAKATDTFHIGPLKLSWTEIKIGIQSGLIAIPVNFLIVTVFRNIKQGGDQTASSGSLPHFFLYIGWSLCICTILASAVFTVFYSLTWGAEISNQWLVSMTFSFFEDVLLIQPIKVLFIVCLLSIIIRKPLDPDEVHRSQYLPEPYSRTGENEKEARILEMEELENARLKRKREVKAFRAIVEIYFFAIFLFLFVVVCYGNRDSVRYNLTESVQALFKEFSKVNDTPSLWKWMRNTFVPGLFNTSWYNGKPFDYDEGFISNRESFLVGMPRLRQVRILPEVQCNSQRNLEEHVFPRCLPFYGEDNEDTTPFNKPGWIPVKNISSFKSNAAELDSLCPKPWQYVTARALKTVPVQGTMFAYGGGGYVANLGYNSESALDIIKSLEESHWIDDKTVAVLIECTFFEPSTSFYSFMRYLYERFPTGGIITSSAVKTVAVYLPHGSNSYRSFYQVCQMLLMLVILGFAIVEITKAFRGGRTYFKLFWSWIDIVLIFFAASGIGIMLYKEKCTRDYVRNVRANPFDNWSADQIMFWSEIEDYLLSVVMFVVTVKSLRLIRFNPHIYQMRTTLRDSLIPLSSFALVFLVVIMAFASFALLFFGSSVFNYSTLPQAVRTLLQLVIGGKSSYYQLKFVSDSFLGPLFIFVYLITSMAILVNMFIAILNESYTTSREETTKDSDDIDHAELAQYLWSCVKSSIRSCHSFYVFIRQSFRSRRHSRKYQVNGYHKTHPPMLEHYAPRLASIDSMDEILYPRLSYAEELLSKVQSRLRRLSDETIEENTDTDQYIDPEQSRFGSELELNSDCDSFLEGNCYYSSTPSSLNFDDNFLLDRLSASDISETSV